MIKTTIEKKKKKTICSRCEMKETYLVCMFETCTLYTLYFEMIHIDRQRQCYINHFTLHTRFLNDNVQINGGFFGL